MTNEILKTLRERRSTKSYENRQISADELDAILDAGLYAPTGGASQSAIMVAVTDKATRDKLSAMNAKIMGITSDPFYGAPTVVIVLAKATAPTPTEDGSLVLGTMLVAAESLGVGACWVHRAKPMFESDEGRVLLKEWGVSGDYIGVGCCTLGYLKGEKKAADPRKSERIVKIG